MRTWDDIDKGQTVLTREGLSIVDTLSFLEAQRIRQGITQSELARKIGMSQPQVAKIESLESMPTLTTLNKYASGLGLQIKLTVLPQTTTD